MTVWTFQTTNLKSGNLSQNNMVNFDRLDSRKAFGAIFLTMEKVSQVLLTLIYVKIALRANNRPWASPGLFSISEKIKNLDTKCIFGCKSREIAIELFSKNFIFSIWKMTRRLWFSHSPPVFSRIKNKMQFFICIKNERKFNRVFNNNREKSPLPPNNHFLCIKFPIFKFRLRAAQTCLTVRKNWKTFFDSKA